MNDEAKTLKFQSKRLNDEPQRVKNEAKRVDDEAKTLKFQAKRLTNEPQRVKNEAKRVDDEAKRLTDEPKRLVFQAKRLVFEAGSSSEMLFEISHLHQVRKSKQNFFKCF